MRRCWLFVGGQLLQLPGAAAVVALVALVVVLVSEAFADDAEIVVGIAIDESAVVRFDVVTPLVMVVVSVSLAAAAAAAAVVVVVVVVVAVAVVAVVAVAVNYQNVHQVSNAHQKSQNPALHRMQTLQLGTHSHRRKGQFQGLMVLMHPHHSQHYLEHQPQCHYHN